MPDYPITRSPDREITRSRELRHALDARLLHGDRVHAELGEIVAGRKSGRTALSQITIADLTGVGFQDTAIASCALAQLA